MAHLIKVSWRWILRKIVLLTLLIIAIALLDNDANYKAYRQGRKIRPVVQSLLKRTGIDVTNGDGIPELSRFQEYFRDYKIVVYQGLGFDDIMFEGQVDTSKSLNLPYGDVGRHYHIITNLNGAMAKRYVCSACHRSCRRDITHVCDQIAATVRRAPVRVRRRTHPLRRM